MKRKIVASLLLYAFVSAHAQTISDTIKTVTIEASKPKENIVSSAPYYGFNSKEMMQHGITDVVDVLHRLPSVVLRDYGGAGGMKTVSVRGLGSQHTGVSYDGVMLSDCQTGQIDLQRYSLNDLSAVRLRLGDADDVFTTARSISASSVLELESSLGEEPKTTIRTTTGSWGFINPFVNYECRLTGTSSLSALLDYVSAKNNYPFSLKNGTIQTTEQRTNSRMSQLHGELNYLWQTNSHRLSAKLYHYDNDRELPGIVHYYTHDNDETLHEKNVFGQLHYKWTGLSQFCLMINAKWNWAQTTYHNGKPSGGITSSDYIQREGYGSIALLYKPHPNVNVSYSGDYVMNSMNGTINSSHSIVRHTLLQALSAKWFVGSLKFLGRVLWSNYHEPLTTKDEISPSISMSYKPLTNKNLHLRASYKNIFRAPSFNEQYFFHLGNQSLSPETTNQFNIGLTDDFSTNRFTLNTSIDAYYNNVRDKIVSVPINMFVWRSVNLARTDGYGLDLMATLSYHLNTQHTVALLLNYSLQHITNTTNRESQYYDYQIAYTPVHSGSITTTWSNPWANLSLTGSGMSDRYTTNEHSEGTHLDGYTEWNITLSRELQLKKGTLRLQGSVLNIFNKQYDIVAHYPMPGRSFRIGVNLELKNKKL